MDDAVIQMALTFDQAHPKPKKPLGRPLPQELGAKRLPWVFALILTWAALAGARLVWIQVYRHEYYQDRALRQHSIKMTINPIRGEIRDRNDEVLATSLPSESLYVTPPVFYPGRSRQKGPDGKIAIDWGEPDIKLAKEYAGKVAKVLGRPESFVLDRFTRKAEWFLVERQLSPIKAAAIKEIDKEILKEVNRDASEKGEKAGKGAAPRQQRREPVFTLLPEHRRIYPRGSVACQAIGFVNDAGEGQLGVERAYNSMLSGRKGVINAPKDGLDNYLILRESYVETPVNGSRLRLTIDSGIQQIVEEVLEETVAQSGPKTAHCVVVDPNTGEILAMAGTPVFDPNISTPEKFKGRLDSLSSAERLELRSWRETQQAARKVHPLEDSYEPGSTMKIFTAAMALEDRKAHIGEYIDCMGGTWQYAPNVPPITDPRRDRALTFEQVLWYSSNIGIAKLGTRLKAADHYRYLKEFGFGTPTGLNFAGETPGRLDAPVTWSMPTQYTLSYGYGLSASPLQVLMAGCAIANGGRLMKPYIVKAVYNDRGALLQENKPEVRHQVISEETSALMREVLKGVITNGTAKKAALDGAEAFGKTGTSRKVIDGQYDSRRHYASFLGFFPADKPEYGILVMLDEPVGDVTGGDVAAPAFKKIGDAILRYSQSTPQPAKGEKSVRLTLLDWPVSEGDEASIHVQKGRTPDVRGLAFRNAVQRVTLVGGTVRVAGTTQSGQSSHGAFKVSSQSPEPGKPLPDDKIVTLHLRAQ